MPRAFAQLLGPLRHLKHCSGAQTLSLCEGLVMHKPRSGREDVAYHKKALGTLTGLVSPTVPGTVSGYLYHREKCTTALSNSDRMILGEQKMNQRFSETPEGQESAFAKEEYVLVARLPVCGKNNYYLLHGHTEKHLPGQQETSKSQDYSFCKSSETAPVG
ncbi:hypothetical protein AV530_000591 [Patagioenas fasciata monilis]|uniref:Uncharacterized protein n=1 Tax=Patagioenas fasciata monilis TaxID=372326 RepID=A0A1V4IFT9_PATFA|nr:hypothetical protein AV530_000591 [Patagioenas fasciata monilis]